MIEELKKAAEKLREIGKTPRTMYVSDETMRTIFTDEEVRKTILDLGIRNIFVCLFTVFKKNEFGLSEEIPVSSQEPYQWLHLNETEFQHFLSIKGSLFCFNHFGFDGIHITRNLDLQGEYVLVSDINKERIETNMAETWKRVREATGEKNG